MSTPGERISKFRAQLGMSKAELARRLTVSPSSVSDWESNRYLPDVGKLPGLAKLLQCSIEDLLDPCDPSSLCQSPEPPGSADRPSWVEDLRASVTVVSERTEAAILDQKEGFIGEMVRIGAQLEKRDARQEERDRRQEERDAQNAALLQGLMSVVANNNALLAETQAALQEARQESRETRETLLKLQGLLDDREDDPPIRVSTEQQNGAQWDGRGPVIQGRIISEGGVA